MSLLTNPEVTPSRVLSLFRLLLTFPEQVALKETLSARCWPMATRSENAVSFDQKNLLEMLEMDLVEEVEGGQIRPNLRLPEKLRDGDPDGVLVDLPLGMANLVFTGEDRNQDLAYALAWYLALDPLDAPGTKTEIPGAARAQGLGEKTGLLNDARFGTFRDWSCYLGLAWQNAGADGSPVLQPDPTQHLRWRFREMLTPEDPFTPIEPLLARLAELSPVFEGGGYRLEVERLLGVERPKRHLSESTSMALLRLEDEGTIAFESRSDMDLTILQFGEQTQRVTHIRRTK